MYRHVYRGKFSVRMMFDRGDETQLWWKESTVSISRGGLETIAFEHLTGISVIR